MSARPAAARAGTAVGEAPARIGIVRGTPEFRRAVVAMMAAGFATFFLMYCVQPLLPEFAREFRLGAADASLSLSVTTGCMGIAMLVFSVVSERVGRRRLMIGSMVAAGLVTLASAAAREWGVFLGARALLGVAFAGLPALAMAYLGEEMSPGALPVAMGLYIAGTGVGGMAGRLLTAALTDLVSWRFAVGTVGVLGLGAAVVFWRALPPSRRAPAAARRAGGWSAFAAHLRDGTMLRLFAVGFAVLGGLVALYNYATFRLMGPPYRLSHTVVGLVFLLYLAGVGSSGWTGHLLGRVGRAPLLRGSLLVMLAGGVITLAHPLPVVIAGIGVATVGFFAAQSVASGWVAAHAQAGRAQGTALYLCFYYLGSSLAGWAGGHAWEVAGWTGVIAFVTGLLAIALVLAWRVPESPRPRIVSA